MTVRAIKIAVMALGGQGGGVLADWLVKAGESAGYIAQSTSVPGVAQRTGATIYYVELFPKSAADEKGASPILALMPAPGDVDVVIAAEMMEAGRALMRGFVSKQTTLIASTHRVYAIGEKIAMSDGRQGADAIRAAVDEAAGRTIWFDMEKAGEEAGAVISAVLLGAIAGTGATPINRSIFEDVIRAGKRAVEQNLTGFSAGFEAAQGISPAPSVTISPPSGVDAAPAVKPLFARISELPAAVRNMAREGVKRVVDFQDVQYGDLYLDRLQKVIDADRGNGGEERRFELSQSTAKYLALAMAYDDVIRVADLKTRASRFARFRDDVRAEPDQIVRVWEYMHPRLEEACDLLPPALAKPLLNSSGARKAFNAVLGKGRRVATTNLSGFFMLSALSALRPLRRSGLRYENEQTRIEYWLELIIVEAPRDYAFARAIASLQRLIKGYSDTHERGLSNFNAIVGVLDSVKATAAPAETLGCLRDAALRDEEGAALRAELAKLVQPANAA